MTELLHAPLTGKRNKVRVVKSITRKRQMRGQIAGIMDKAAIGKGKGPMLSCLGGGEVGSWEANAAQSTPVEQTAAMCVVIKRD